MGNIANASTAPINIFRIEPPFTELNYITPCPNYRCEIKRRQAALMNLTLDGMETLLADNFPTHSLKLARLTRFADDFIITGKSQELLENEVKPLITVYLKERGLQLSEGKTRITHINEGFDFLTPKAVNLGEQT